MIESLSSQIKDILLQGILLQDDELLLYKEESGDWHVFTTQPYDSDKKYNIIKMTWEDFI